MLQGCGTICHFKLGNKHSVTGSFMPTSHAEEKFKKIKVARGPTFKLRKIDPNQGPSGQEDQSYNLPKP